MGDSLAVPVRVLQRGHQSPHLGARATPPSVATAQIDFWTGAPNAVLLADGSDFLDTLLPLLSLPRVRGAIVHDARVAALCLSHGVEVLLTRDRDFQIFPQLVTRDPRAEAS